MISNVQTNIFAEFQSLQDSGVSSLTERVLDVGLQLSSRTPSSATSSGSDLESSGNPRKRHIPLKLQVSCIKLLLYLCLHMVHFVQIIFPEFYDNP